MYLTISKRFEFSASHRYFRHDWTPEQNRAVFGKAMGTEHGYGQNYTAYFVFHGDTDSKTGMVINVTAIKEKIKALLAERFDHKFLNVDTPPFDSTISSPENIARQLLIEATPLFEDSPATPVACHLSETPWREATAYADGRLESHYRLEFSAARRTYSPHLSERENLRLFGIASSPGGHGHSYILRITLGGETGAESGMIVPDLEVQAVLRDLHELLDHRNLSRDVADLSGMPITTEYLSRYIWCKLAGTMPLLRVRLHEKRDFFAEYHGGKRFFIGVEDAFNAAHRLHSPFLTDEENQAIYEKCNNIYGHGHLYRVEATLSGELDERSGILYPLTDLVEGLSTALAPWDYKHLNLDTKDFADIPSTSENMINLLWPRVDTGVAGALHRLRLWETPNNRFTMRRDI